MIKKLVAGVSAVGVSALSFAQDTGNVALGTYMDSLVENTTTEVNAFLPKLGEIAIIGLVLFLALWAFRAVKRFLGR